MLAQLLAQPVSPRPRIDHLGVGYVTQSKWDLGLKIQHYSNASIKRPNSGANFLVAEKYVDAIRALATAPNQKVLIIPTELGGIAGTLGGIAEITTAVFGDGTAPAPARPAAGARPRSASRGSCARSDTSGRTLDSPGCSAPVGPSAWPTVETNPPVDRQELTWLSRTPTRSSPRS